MTAARLVTPQPARHSRPIVKATSLAHVIFQRPDLAATEAFLTDFGLHPARHSASTLFFRGSGPSPYCYRVHQATQPAFVGFGLTVASRSDLELLAALPGASPITPVTHPGGGECVTLFDPSGFKVEVIHGQERVSELTQRAPLAFNSGALQPRVNAGQRPAHRPPQVIKLGHVVLEVADYQDTSAWYTRHFGFIPSDVQVLPDGSPAVTFFRLDLGDTPADHHSLALVQAFMPAYSHSAYEVVDADAVGMGQQVLRERGWRHAWGIGRHILGSQIFDYWSDPWGSKHEHYCDGDAFTAEQPMGIHAAGREAMAQWGEPMPASFARPPITAATIAALFRNLRRSPDVTFDKLRTLARLFA